MRAETRKEAIGSVMKLWSDHYYVNVHILKGGYQLQYHSVMEPRPPPSNCLHTTLYRLEKYQSIIFALRGSTACLCFYSHQYTNPEQITEKAPSGCYVSGLYLEGARWDQQKSCLIKSLPKVLVEELPILRVIPIEAHRLKLVVSTNLVPRPPAQTSSPWLRDKVWVGGLGTRLGKYINHQSVMVFGHKHTTPEKHQSKHINQRARLVLTMVSIETYIPGTLDDSCLRCNIY